MNNISSKVRNTEIFSLFPKYEGQAFPYNKTPERADKISDVDMVSINNKKKTSKKKKILFGSTIASTILTAGIIGLIFAKGLHGGSFKRLSKISNTIEDTLRHTGQSGTKNITAKTLYYAKAGTKKTAEGLEATANFTAIKDSFCDKVFKSNKVTRKFSEKATSFFKKIVDRTLGKKYDKVEVKVKDLTSLLKHYNIANINNLDEAQKLQQITIKGQTRTLGEWIQILGENTEKLQTAFDENFSLGARKLRDQKRSRLLDIVPQKVKDRFFKDKKSLFNLKNYSTYVTEDASKEAHKILTDDITGARKKVTNNISSIYDELRKSFISFNDSVKPEDETSKMVSQKIRDLLEKFKTCSGSDEIIQRGKISESLLSYADDVMGEIRKSSLYTPEEIERMSTYISEIRQGVISSGSKSKGALEEIMTVLKGLNSAVLDKSDRKIISDENFKEFSKLSSKITKGLKKATDLETGEYFMKQAELKVGSAPTDVLSVLFPIGAGALAIGTSENKDERVSAVLTTCIPLVGTFATFVYGTVKMFSGAKNLLFSLSTGALISMLGNYTNKLYKKYKDSGSIVNVVKNEYDHLVTEITPQYAKSLLPQKEKKTSNK